MLPWEFKYRGDVPAKIREENPIANSCYAFGEDTMHFFVKDKEHPYIQTKPFEWIRGYQVGASRSCGPDRYNAGATWILKAQLATVLPWIGPSDTRILTLGTLM